MIFNFSKHTTLYFLKKYTSKGLYYIVNTLCNLKSLCHQNINNQIAKMFKNMNLT